MPSNAQQVAARENHLDQMGVALGRWLWMLVEEGIQPQGPLEARLRYPSWTLALIDSALDPRSHPGRNLRAATPQDVLDARDLLKAGGGTNNPETDRMHAEAQLGYRQAREASQHG